MFGALRRDAAGSELDFTPGPFVRIRFGILAKARIQCEFECA